MVYLYVFISLMTSFYRTVFLDLIMSLLLFSSFQINVPQTIKSFALKIMVGIVIQTILDIFWFVIFFKPYWNSGYDDGFRLRWLRRTIDVFSIILIIIRALVLVALGIQFKNMDQGKNEFETNNAVGQLTTFDPNQNQNKGYPGLP